MSIFLALIRRIGNEHMSLSSTYRRDVFVRHNDWFICVRDIDQVGGWLLNDDTQDTHLSD